MGVVVVDPPAWPLVSLEVGKAHLQVEHSDDDAQIAAWLNDLSEELDGPPGDLGRALGVQTLRATFTSFAALAELPYPPIRSIVSISYLDASGASVPLDADTYEIYGAGDYFVGVRPVASGCWPPLPYGGWYSASAASRASEDCRQNTVTVEFEAGYDVLPGRIRSAILLRLGDLYANRESQSIDTSRGTVVVNPTVDRLLSRFRDPVIR